MRAPPDSMEVRRESSIIIPVSDVDLHRRPSKWGKAFRAVTRATHSFVHVELYVEQPEDREDWVAGLTGAGWIHLGDAPYDPSAIAAAFPFNGKCFETTKKARRRRLSIVLDEPWWKADGLAVGTAVDHPKRGHGVVVSVERDGEQKVGVQFDAATTGGVHRYNAESWKKKMKHDAQVSRVLEGMLRQGGGGTNKIAQHMQGWSLFRLYSDSRVKARRSLMSARESNVVCIPDQGFGAVRVHPDNARRFDLYTSTSRDQLAIMVGLREDVKPCEAGGSGSGGGGEAGADDDKPVLAISPKVLRSFQRELSEARRKLAEKERDLEGEVEEETSIFIATVASLRTELASMKIALAAKDEETMKLRRFMSANMKSEPSAAAAAAAAGENVRSRHSEGRREFIQEMLGELNGAVAGLATAVGTLRSTVGVHEEKLAMQRH